MCLFKSILKLDSQEKEMLLHVTVSAKVYFLPKEIIGQPHVALSLLKTAEILKKIAIP